MNTMMTNSKLIKACLTPLLTAFYLFSNSVLAGEYGSQEEIQREISFLAKKLLDMNQVDEYTLVSDVKLSPYIGICTVMKKRGIVLTCVSPGSQASKAGLVTGDIVVNINELSMRNQESHRERNGKTHKQAYWSIINNMKVNDQLKFELIRSGELMTIEVSVGSLSHPGYTLEIKR